MDKQKILLELMYDFIEKILTPREYEIFTLYKIMKPRYIAEKIGTTAHNIRVSIYRIKRKINEHEQWLKEKKELRGLVV